MSKHPVPLHHALQLTTALAQLAHIAGDLPGPQTMRIHWDNTEDRWSIDGFLFTLDGDDADIDAIRAWDAALGGRLHLEEPHTFEYTTHTRTSRRLKTTAELFGVHVKLDVDIDDHTAYHTAYHAAAEPQAIAA